MGVHDAAVCCDNKSDSICPSPYINPWFCNWQKPPHHISASSMLYTWCDTEGCSSFTNSLPHTDSSIKILNFDSSVQRTLFHCPIVQSLCTLAHWSLLTFFCFLNSGFLTAILPFRPVWQSLLLMVDVDTFFHDISSIVQWCLEQSAFWWYKYLYLYIDILIHLWPFMTVHIITHKVYFVYYSDGFVGPSTLFGWADNWKCINELYFLWTILF